MTILIEASRVDSCSTGLGSIPATSKLFLKTAWCQCTQQKGTKMEWKKYTLAVLPWAKTGLKTLCPGKTPEK